MTLMGSRCGAASCDRSGRFRGAAFQHVLMMPMMCGGGLGPRFYGFRLKPRSDGGDDWHDRRLIAAHALIVIRGGAGVTEHCGSTRDRGGGKNGARRGPRSAA